MEDKPKTIADIVDLGQFKSLKDAEAYCEKLTQTCISLQETISKLKEENFHLKQLLVDAGVQDGDIVTLSKSPEENICRVELGRLQDIAYKRSLTLEETKKTDLLIRSLYLITGKTTRKVKKKEEEISDDVLLQIVANQQEADNDTNKT